MNNPTSARKAGRVQTTISVLSDAIEGVDMLAMGSGVSRSRLMDLAIRRFLRWASQLDPQDLQLIAEYEVTEPIAQPLVRRSSSTMARVQAPTAPPPAPATAPPPPEDNGPITPHDRPRRLPEEAPPARSRDRAGRYVPEGR